MPVYWQRQATVSDNMHVYILYMRREDIILAILWMGIPITTTVASEWLSSLIFHDDIKCITANG